MFKYVYYIKLLKIYNATCMHKNNYCFDFLAYFALFFIDILDILFKINFLKAFHTTSFKRILKTIMALWLLS